MNIDDMATGTHWLKIDSFEDDFVAEIQSASIQDGNFGKQVVLEFEKFSFSIPKGLPNIQTLIDGFGNDEKTWVGRSVKFSKEPYIQKSTGNTKIGIVTTPQTVVVGNTAASANKLMEDPPKPNLDDSEDTDDLPF